MTPAAYLMFIFGEYVPLKIKCISTKRRFICVISIHIEIFYRSLVHLDTLPKPCHPNIKKISDPPGDLTKKMLGSQSSRGVAYILVPPRVPRVPRTTSVPGNRSPQGFREEVGRFGHPLLLSLRKIDAMFFLVQSSTLGTRCFDDYNPENKDDNGKKHYIL